MPDPSPSPVRVRASAGRRAVFLDRDGVLNRAFVRDGRPHPPARVDDLEVLPGVAAAVERLREAGFATVVVTNQPDIARGTATRAGVDAIHRALRSVVPVDDVLVCPHDDADGCGCRKPRPGLLVEAARRRGLDLAASVMVGDRWRDVEAGRRAGCRTVFVDRGYDEPRPAGSDAEVPDLPAAVTWILGGGSGGGRRRSDAWSRGRRTALRVPGLSAPGAPARR
ncbi:MAG TPA: HAD family hydrolase [Acidimicrobiales bacterium]